MAAPFPSRLLSTIAKQTSTKNLLFSPISIKSCLMMIYLGADDNTAEEIKQALNLADETRAFIMELIHLSQLQTRVPITIVSGMFVDTQFKIDPTYNRNLSQRFNFGVEKVNFYDVIQSVGKINSWMRARTDCRIRNLIAPYNVDCSTVCVVINSAYFRGEWKYPFNTELTEKRNFHVNKKRVGVVSMMFQENSFLYGHLKYLEAYAVEIPYESFGIVMLILLPKVMNGLSALESKLKMVDLTKLSAELKMENVHLGLPKFKLEFDISLQPILEELGMKTMFSKYADFSNLLITKAEFFLSDVKHKVVIDVDEMGTEAMTGKLNSVTEFSEEFKTTRNFIVDRPFFFAVLDKENVHFAGHVTEL